MRRLSQIIVFLGLAVNLLSQSPHGPDLKIDCAACHSTEGWVINNSWELNSPAKPKFSAATGWELVTDTARFHHNKTDYPLLGQHISVDCRSCHQSLIFSEASPECISCHTDMHQQTVGADCARCHDSENWLVDNISELHYENGFPLVGAHSAAGCFECHTSETALRFDRIGNDCINCHLDDYTATLHPKHQEAGFSKDCSECHDVFKFDWTTSQVNHDFFPLTKGHDISDCTQCHTSGDFGNTPNTCVACHQTDFNNTNDPNHQSANFPTDCASCHTTDPGWMPAEFLEHDASFFPIYSGKHQGQWDKCSDCHSNSSDYGVFTCTNCHLNPETNNSHDGVSGYVYEDPACLVCHPTGDAEGGFDHNSTDFPLTGAHIGVDCIECHANGYAGTPTACAACHTGDFNQTDNPDHVALGFPTDCASCHTTDPGWMPATFDIHNEYYQLNGAHTQIDCAACHNGDYNNTPNTCVGCHLDDFNQTTEPDHGDLQFSTDCASCHSESAWQPATFDHDGQYFPIYSGKHDGEWNQCADCHTNPSDYSVFTCITCHTNPGTNNDHDGVNGYSYNSPACLACHPTGEADFNFNHNSTNFPLTGAHTTTDCIACHAGGFEGTPMDCAACHTTEFSQTTNPDHEALGLSTDCAMCHTTSPDWDPATFPVHNTFYQLNGAHAQISNDCAACHNGNYNNTPNTCVGCHLTDFNNTNNPDHQALQFSTDCESCHTENAWEPSTFDHDGQYFPIYSGKHDGEWDQCTDCHTNPSNYSVFTCITCHSNPQTDDDHDGVNGYSYNSPACLACHPTGDANFNFNHNATGFPLTGEHITTDCLECHSGGFQNTPTECLACHESNFNQTTNPNHNALGFSNDCASCHTTVQGWNPAMFADHNSVYALNGAHAAIANDCAVCHNGDYNNTPNTCVGCHSTEYNQATEPDHEAAQFSTDCAACHTENAWTPSTFDHDGMYFPIYSGSHNGEWDQCVECHTNPSDYAVFTCTTCHTNPETNDQHNGVGGYSYNSPACLACHPTGDSDINFDHNNTNFPLTGAHTSADCIDCHAGGYQGTPTDCNACHSNDYNLSLNPSHVMLGLPTDCASCHTTAPGWEPATFGIHDNFYPLDGAHTAVANDCDACHNGDYVNTPNTCASCHATDYSQSTNPNHGLIGLPMDCAMCHTTAPDWAPATFPIHNDFYALNGAHAAIAEDCAACHNGNYSNTPSTCAGCHLNDYNQTTNPDHQAAQFPTDCQSCHTENAWVPSSFNHNIYYPLTGAHIPIANDCAACHINGNYDNTPNTCQGCHAADYAQSANPNHQALGISTNCATCHTTAPGWMPAAFPTHDDYYVLMGAHATIANDCDACHNGNYNNTPNTCFGCHQSDYNDTNDPDHQVAQFPTDCASCHSQNAWTPSSFNHNIYYPLTGAHIPIANDCAACHINGNYDNTPNTCQGCHTADYAQSTNPNHQALGIPTNCGMCHTTASDWMPAAFPTHNNYYVLMGAHAAIANDCDACHNGNYNNTPNTCFGCHQTEYNNTNDPDHQVAQFPTDCASCHSQNAWTPSSFNHNIYYPLTGAHLPIANDCAACHINGNYNNTPNTCQGCHTADYAQSTNPNHQALGIPTNCAMCHTTAPDWMPATFPIHNNYYQLIGAHAAIANDCDACHNGNYNNTPSTCFGCHQSEYNNTNDPDHQSAQFPTTCQDCHTQSSWTPSTWDHDDQYFPIYSGNHNGEWDQCVDCHIVPGNYAIFSCIDCHEHDNQNEVNNDHQGVQGYSYTSTACYSCHPNGDN